MDAEESSEVPDGYRWQPLLNLGAQLDTPSWMLAGRAVQLVEWSRTSRFCGRCGTPTELAARERAASCPRCGLNAYPRLAPAIIVTVERGDEILLGQGRGFQGMYSALAGFAEPGETLEETVRREVREEVGVEVGLVRYFGSQPWPFPHSLMIGFSATWSAGEIQIDGEEIVDAQMVQGGRVAEYPASPQHRQTPDRRLGQPAGLKKGSRRTRYATSAGNSTGYGSLKSAERLTSLHLPSSASRCSSRRIEPSVAFTPRGRW